jgi:hypothetical protein
MRKISFYFNQCTVVQEPVQVPDELPAGGEGVEQGGETPVPGQHLPLRAPRVRQGRHTQHILYFTDRIMGILA